MMRPNHAPANGGDPSRLPSASLTDVDVLKIVKALVVLGVTRRFLQCLNLRETEVQGRQSIYSE